MRFEKMQCGLLLLLLMVTLTKGSFFRSQHEDEDEEAPFELHDIPHAKLNNHVWFPLVGMGVGNLVHESIVPQIELGIAHYDGMRYCLIDTAHESRNEHLVQEGIQRGLNHLPEHVKKELMNDKKRPIIHVVTKIWYTYLGYERTKLAVKEILSQFEEKRNVQLHILLHWPRCRTDISWMNCEKEEQDLPQHVKEAGPPPHLDKDHALVESWKALEDIYLNQIKVSPLQQNLIASIGVSNFELDDFEKLEAMWRVTPSMLQGNIWSVIFDPKLMYFLAHHDILFQAYNVMNGVFGRHKHAKNALQSLTGTARTLTTKYREDQKDKAVMNLEFTPQMVVLQWLIQQEFSVIPRTSSPQHLELNSPILLAHMPELDDEEHLKVGSAIKALLEAKDLEPPHASFLNQSKDSLVHIFWSNDEGKHVLVGKVPPGGTFDTTTYPGHVFVVKHENHAQDSSLLHQEFTITADYGQKEEHHIVDQMEEL